MGQFRISLLQLLVQSDELFIGGLELFFGSLELLVGAVKLLHAGLGFFVRRLQFFVGGFLLLDDCLQVVARPGEIVLHLDQLPIVAFLQLASNRGFSRVRRDGRPPRTGSESTRRPRGARAEAELRY
jgi:hypothetical protein